MLSSFALIFIVGLISSSLCKSVRLPGIIGMLAAGILIGPFALDLIDDSVLNISDELRQTALIIILIRAGLTLDMRDLKKVGRPALMMSFIPACFEIAGYILLAPVLLGTDRIESALMGAVLSAVSPAVVVPRMVYLTEEKYGTEKGIPQMILAGASCDDIFVIVIFSTFLGMAQGGTADAGSFLDIPVSIFTGISAGVLSGLLLHFVFESFYGKNHKIRNSLKIIIILSTAFLLMSAETVLKGTAAFSGLLAVTAMACMIKLRSENKVTARLSEKFGKLWLAAEIILFVLVGAAVDIRYTLSAGAAAAVLILTALLFRSAGVCLCVAGTKLTFKEKAFCVISYLPKATVQAAIGSVPLSLGLSCGSKVLSAAVLGIIMTAPLGAIGIDMTYKRFLNKNS